MGEKKRLYVREQAGWQRACSLNRLSTRQLTVQDVPGGIMLPPDNWNPQTGEFQGGVCDREGNFVAGLMRGKPPHAGFYGVASAYPVNEAELAYEDKVVIFGGILIGHFGHFILECLGRLWYVLEHADPGIPIVFLTELEVCRWYGAFFDLLGIPRERIILLRRPTRFLSVTVPEEAVHSWHDYTPAYLVPYRFMVQQAQKRTGRHSLGKKIFLTRSSLKDSQTKCVNEEYFVKFFARQGFVPVELETLPLPEQVAIVANAEEIVAVMGSLTHWALFCRPGTKFTMLTRTSNDILASQCLINAASQVDWYIVDTAMNVFYANRAVGVCLIGPTVYWQEYVREHYGHWQDDGSWKRVYHEYLREWTDYILQPQKWGEVSKLDALALLTRINRALHQNETLLAAEQAARPAADLLLADEDKLYFWSEKDCSLGILQPETGEAVLIYHRPEREAPAPLYGALVKAGSHLVLVPENAAAVLDYDEESGQTTEVPLPHALPRGNFRYALAYGGMVIMIGYHYRAIMAYQPAVKEISCLQEWLDVLRKMADAEHLPLGGKPCLLDDKLYVPVIDTNQVVELSLINNNCAVHHVGDKAAAYGFAAAYAGNIWLAPSQGGPLAVWNPPTGVMQVFGDFPQDFAFAKVAGKIRFFTDILTNGVYLWLLPWGANRLLRLNMETGKIEAVPLMLSAALPHTRCGCVLGERLYLADGERRIRCLEGTDGRGLTVLEK